MMMVCFQILLQWLSESYCAIRKILIFTLCSCCQCFPAEPCCWSARTLFCSWCKDQCVEVMFASGNTGKLPLLMQHIVFRVRLAKVEFQGLQLCRQMQNQLGHTNGSEVPSSSSLLSLPAKIVLQRLLLILTKLSTNSDHNYAQKENTWAARRCWDAKVL